MYSTDQELAGAAAYSRGRGFVFTHQVAALCCVKWRHCRHLESMTTACILPIIYAVVWRRIYTFTWLTFLPTSSRFDLKWRDVRLLWRDRPSKNNKNQISSDMRSVPDLKLHKIISSIVTQIIVATLLFAKIMRLDKQRRSTNQNRPTCTMTAKLRQFIHLIAPSSNRI